MNTDNTDKTDSTATNQHQNTTPPTESKPKQTLKTIDINGSRPVEPSNIQVQKTFRHRWQTPSCFRVKSKFRKPLT